MYCRTAQRARAPIVIKLGLQRRVVAAQLGILRLQGGHVALLYGDLAAQHADLGVVLLEQTELLRVLEQTRLPKASRWARARPGQVR